MVKRSLYPVVDFDLWGKTYGNVLYIDVRMNSSRAHRTLRKALRCFDHLQITNELTKRAVNQVGIEYQRPLVSFGDELTQALNVLHGDSWKDIELLDVNRATESTSVNTVFSTTGLKYGSHTPAHFSEVYFHFEVDETLYRDNPAMKVLAVLVVQAVALSVHQELSQTYTFYDCGDEWDVGAETVAYRTHLQFVREGAPTVADLSVLVGRLVCELSKSRIAAGVESLIKKLYNVESHWYFSLEKINEITGGVTLGHKGWLTVSRRKYIQNLLESVTVSVHKV